MPTIASANIADDIASENRLLELGNINAFYGERQVLFDVNLSVAQGGSVALLGANGAGKTTTLRAISGMLKTTGRMKFEGQSTLGKATNYIARRGVGHVPDGRGTFTGLTVAENLRIGSYLRNLSAEVEEDTDRIIRYFPILGKRFHQQAGTLSGGEQQMLAISRALLLKPKLLLLDEPSFGLAPIIVQEIFSILREIRSNEKLSILIVEQNVRLALDLAERAYLLETGRIVFNGSSQELADNDNIRRAYLGQ